MITNDAINVALRRVEDEVPVESWSIDGVRVWPLVKADIASESFRAGRQVVGKSAPKRLVDRHPLRPAIEMLRANARRMRAKARDSANEQRLEPADALLYSDGASFVKLDGTYFERFCDPVREQLAARGKTAAMLTPLAEFQVPRYAPSLFVQSRLDAARVAARAKNLIARHDTHLPAFDQAMTLLRDALPGVRLGDVTHYERLVTYLEAYQAVYGKILAVVRPRVVFVVCYYAIEPMALIRECHARGAVTVDLQHGCINDSHFAYAARHRFPPGGFDLLPDVCWVWSADEEQTIRSWTRDDPSAPKAVVGGNPFLETWRDERVPFVRDATERVFAIKNGTSGLAHVMYTTQGYETENDLDRLTDAIRHSSDRFYWWVRLHPANPGARPIVEAALARAQTGTYVVQSHTDIPLYGVLRHMDAHVTHSSSTVIEAAAFGVPSVLTSPGEAVMYKQQIEAGWAVVVDEREDLVATVASQIAAAPALRQRASGSSLSLGPAVSERALGAVFQMSAARPAR